MNDNKVQTHLDYSLTTDEERLALVNKIIKEFEDIGEKPSNKYLEKMGDYLFKLDLPKQSKILDNILTPNRMVTINKHECSLEGLVEGLPLGEDQLYNLISTTPNEKITKYKKLDEEEINKDNDIKKIQDAIDTLNNQLPNLTGKKLYQAKKTIIELCQQKYLIHSLKNDSNIGLLPLSQKTFNVKKDSIITDEELDMDENGHVVDYSSINLTNPKHVAAILEMYDEFFKEDYSSAESDNFKLLIEEINDIILHILLPKNKIWYDIFMMKTDGYDNISIQQYLKDNENYVISTCSISTIWTKRIPKFIAEETKKKNEIYYYKKYDLKLKQCKKCGKWYPPTDLFFHKNRKNKDELGNVCKECRRSGQCHQQNLERNVQNAGK